MRELLSVCFYLCSMNHVAIWQISPCFGYRTGGRTWYKYLALYSGLCEPLVSPIALAIFSLFMYFISVSVLSLPDLDENVHSICNSNL